MKEDGTEAISRISVRECESNSTHETPDVEPAVDFTTDEHVIAWQTAGRCLATLALIPAGA